MKFVSKKKDLRLVIRPTTVAMDQNRRPIVNPGEHVEFHGGVFHTDNDSLIDYLIAHKSYGLAFTSELGGDAVNIRKQHLVFDDGAELSGPKIVAGFPEKNKPISDTPPMIHGATSTVNAPQNQREDRAMSRKSEKQATKETSVSKEEIEALIDAKLDKFLDRIGSLVIQPKIRKDPRVFKCPLCEEVFNSSFAVGKHKKEIHPTSVTN
jgi:hypothetical protein